MNTKLIKPAVVFLFLLFTGFRAIAAPLTARVEFSDVRKLSFNYDGIVSEVKIRAGEQVKAGATLARLDDALLKLEIAQKKQALAAIKPLFDEADKDYQRALELYDRSVLAEKDLEKARVEYDRQYARLSQSKAALQFLQHKKTYYTLQAPYQAVVLENHFYPGYLVRNTMRLSAWVLLARSNQLAFRVSVPQGERKWQIGQKVTARIAEKTYPATLEAIEYNKEAVKLKFVIGGKNILPLLGKTVTIE